MGIRPPYWSYRILGGFYCHVTFDQDIQGAAYGSLPAKLVINRQIASDRNSAHLQADF